jgi:hypothetical protein
MMPPPNVPQYDPAQMRAVNTHDILQRQQPATPGTWIVGILLVVAAVAWMTLLVTRSHDTSAMHANAVTSPAAAPRSATRAP